MDRRLSYFINPRPTTVVDLMDALKKSLSKPGAGGKQPDQNCPGAR